MRDAPGQHRLRHSVVVASATIMLIMARAGVTAAPDEAKKFQPNPRLTAIPENTWERVAGFAPAPAGILAYSGGVYDSINHRLLIFGGGHADYWGNEVCAFSPSTFSWTRMYEPDSRDRYRNDNIDNVKGKLKDSDKPFTRHTYNQLCFLPNSAVMFIFGGAGPGWGDIRPTCPNTPDCWSYSFAENRWTWLYSGSGTPSGYAMACCSDPKRDVVWAFGRDSQLSKFDLKTKAWSTRTVRPPIDYLGTYNFHMIYLPNDDRLLVVGSDTCTIALNSFTSERRPLEKASGKAGLAYLPDHDVVLYVSLPGGETGSEYRIEAFDCATGRWETVDAKGLTACGAVWNRLHFDPVDNVLLLVVDSGVWAYKPPRKFSP